MKLPAFEEIDKIDAEIKSLEERRKYVLSSIQNHCSHPAALRNAVDGGAYPDGWGGTEYHEPTIWRCGMCDFVIKKETK